MVTPAGTYSPAADVGASLALSHATGSVIKLVGDSSDGVALKDKYIDSGLRGIADKARLFLISAFSHYSST